MVVKQKPLCGYSEKGLVHEQEHGIRGLQSVFGRIVERDGMIEIFLFRLRFCGCGQVVLFSGLTGESFGVRIFCSPIGSWHNVEGGPPVAVILAMR